MFRSFLITRYMHVLERDEGRLFGLFLYPLDNLLLRIICFLQCLFSSQIIYSSFWFTSDPPRARYSSSYNRDGCRELAKQFGMK